MKSIFIFNGNRLLMTFWSRTFILWMFTTVINNIHRLVRLDTILRNRWSKYDLSCIKLTIKNKIERECQ